MSDRRLSSADACQAEDRGGLALARITVQRGIVVQPCAGISDRYKKGVAKTNASATLPTCGNQEKLCGLLTMVGFPLHVSHASQGAQVHASL